ncbi:MAG: asparagine synthetase B [Clostridia bacterium]
MRYTGLFFAREPKALMGLLDAPYAVMGRHALCAHDSACDGGAMACAVGRIRNGQALARELADAGMRVKREGGLSALVLAAYRLWGEDYPAKLEGPVGTAVIDQDAGRLVLSRDRMGESSLFYIARGAFVAFSDHPAPLLNAPFGRREVDADGLRELFALGPARTPGTTPVAGVKALEPGCQLIADGKTQRVRRYFALEARPHEDDERRTIERVREMLSEALAFALPLEPAAMLSGGLDSTILTGLAAQKSARPIDTWSVSYLQDEHFFTQNDYQHERDAPFALFAAQEFGTNHHEVILDQASLAEGLHDAMMARGLPGMADVDVSLYLFARRIAKENRAVLSGECADEVFGGYPWFHKPQLIHTDGFPWSGSLELRERVLKKSVREKLNLLPYAAARYHEAAAQLPRLSGEAPEQARLRLVHGLCLNWFMPNLQERASRMCEKNGLAVLTPFCDDRLAQYAYNIPWEMKNLGDQPKGLLRAAYADLLPDALRNRRKSPYPKTHHPEYTRLVCERMARVLRDKDAPIAALLDADEVLRLMASGLPAGDTPWYGQLMTGPQMIAYLLQVNDFLRTFDLNVAL